MSSNMMIKHWLLNLAVEYSVWLGHLFPAVDCEALNVKPVPGCKAEDYARSMIELCDSGMVRLSSEIPGDDVGSKSGVERILDRFLKLANEDPALRHHGRLRPTFERNRLPGMQVDFKLTARGGEAWETMSDPDWTHILIVRVDSQSGDLFSPDRRLLMAYMGWYEEIEAQRIQPGAVTWQTHSDFEILYWKRLPLVYQASFSAQSTEGHTGPKWSAVPKWFREWYLSAITWHKQPWELPGWPSA
jgi:hypothetical protein